VQTGERRASPTLTAGPDAAIQKPVRGAWRVTSEARHAPEQPQLTGLAQLSTLPFIDFGLSGRPRKLTVAKHKRRYELSPMVRARANTFQVCKQYPAADIGE